MKCPICGNDHFIKINPPLIGSDGGAVRSRDCYGCTECGYIFFKSDSAPKKFKQTQEWLKMNENQIKEFDKMIEEVTINSTDIEYEKRLLKNYKEELEYLKNRGEESKRTRKLTECINELEPIVKGVKKVDTEEKIQRLTARKEQLLKERVGIENTLTYFKE